MPDLTCSTTTTRNPLNSYLTSTVDKTHQGPVFASSSVQLLQFFYVPWSFPSNQTIADDIFGYAANYNAQETFMNLLDVSILSTVLETLTPMFHPQTDFH